MRLIQVGGAARRLECSAGWVRYLADTGRLPSCRTTTGLRLFKEEDLW
jgi:DNA-binding transcriptional MerR regulator